MIKKFQIIVLSLLCSFMSLEPVMAETILHGTVRSAKFNPNTYRNSWEDRNSCNNFPVNRYQFYPVEIFDLHYDEHVLLKERVKNLYAFVLIPDAQMTPLPSEKQGISKFSLKLKGGDWLHYTGAWVPNVGPMLESGGAYLKRGHSLKLTTGENTEFIIEGKIENINGKTRWVSFNRNPYFDIQVRTFSDCKYEVKLVRLQDIPVLVTT